ncbi:MAG: type II secretion system F family protein [Actinobacteria bacterium]|nr:type II secretion system F family protein [Actinomycetota bacterium]MCA1721509.1 type II secretion system F family protein [Actinomycetota bacterium]
MGALLGLLFGLGCLLVWRSGSRAPARAESKDGWSEKTRELLAQAGIEGVSPGQLMGASISLGLVVAVLVLGTSHVPVIALAFGGFAGLLPFALVRRRRTQRSVELRELWPDAVDNLASGVRAGLSLPEALTALGVRGPEQLRSPFRRFGEDYRATGRFNESLNTLKANLADPVGDRVVEALRMAREVGGTDLGRLLRTLSGFLREDARTRAELETRQGWTVNAARLALAAPWLILLLLSTKPQAVEAYNQPAGAVVLLAGGGVSFVAYRVMIRIARLPTERRVLK